MGRLKTIIFDFFDVVHKDPQKAWLAANGLTRSGGFAEASDLFDTGQINYLQYIDRLALHSGKTRAQVLAEFHSHADLYDDVVKRIKSLKQHDQRIGLLSNTNLQEIGPLLKTHNLQPLFDDIVISAEVGMHKPDPRIFLLALDRLAALPGDTIFVDDSLHNVKTAASLGIFGIHHTGMAALDQGLAQAGARF